MITDQLLGKRLEDAAATARQQDVPICQVTHYQAPKPSEGKDQRVVRARMGPDGLELVVCSFQTTIE